MRKLFVLLTVFFACTKAQSQCAIDTTIQMPGFHPDTGTYLKPACQYSQYDEVIQIYAPQSVTVSFGNYPVNYVRLDSIPDLPSDLHYSTNPASGTMQGGERGCINIYGSVLAAPGNYQLTIYYTANFNFNGTPLSLGFIAPYKVHVDTGTKTYFTFNDTCCSNNGYYFGKTWLNTTGTYLDTVSNAAGCDSVITLNLFAKQFDTAVVISNDTLYAPAGYSSYSWINCTTNSPVPNANGNTFVFPTACCYSAVMNNNGCTDTSACFAFTDIKNINAEQFTLLPNPVTDKLTLNFDKPLNRLITVYNMLGAKILQHETESAIANISTSGLSNGTYLVVVNSGKGISRSRFIKTE